MPAEAGVARGCGDAREEGGLYLEVSPAPDGIPFRQFLFDPPIVLTQDQLIAIPRVGITLVDGADGVMHVIDWVGKEGYPYATDFIEEGMRKGFSRRISEQVEIERLTPGKSMILFVHPLGSLHNWQEYAEAEEGEEAREFWCLTKHPGEVGPIAEMCIALLWAAAAPMRDTPDGPVRDVADLAYRVYPAVTADGAAAYVAAFIGGFPITNFTVIKAEGDAHRDTLMRARNATTFPVLEESA